MYLGIRRLLCFGEPYRAPRPRPIGMKYTSLRGDSPRLPGIGVDPPPASLEVSLFSVEIRSCSLLVGIAEVVVLVSRVALYHCLAAFSSPSK